MKRNIHLIVGVAAMTIIATFLISTLLVEILGSKTAVAVVKRLILMPGLLFLIPCIAVAGGTGFVLSKSRKERLVRAKRNRMPLIAANGVLILIPAAVYLDRWASAGVFDTKFYLLQLLEVLAGTTNLVLIGSNIRDGFRLSRRI